MADFPTTVYSPAQVNANDKITSARTNNQDAEITAIEDGLRNGTAPLNSSNSTFASLSVPGPVTFSTQTYIFPSSRATVGDVLTVASTSGSTATLQWQSGNVLANGGTISTGVIQQNSLPSWNVWVSAAVAKAANSSAAFNFDTEDFVKGNVTHSTGTNSSRISVTSTGLYFICAKAIVESGGANDSPEMDIRFNDASSNVLSAKVKPPAGQALTTSPLIASGLVRVSSAGYFTVTTIAADNSTWGNADPGLAVRFSGYFVG